MLLDGLREMPVSVKTQRVNLGTVAVECPITKLSLIVSFALTIFFLKDGKLSFVAAEEAVIGFAEHKL